MVGKGVWWAWRRMAPVRARGRPGRAVIAAIAAGVLSFTGERERSAVRVWSAEHGHYHDANGVQVP